MNNNKFKETLMHSIITTIPKEWKKSCFYIFILKSPYLVGLLAIGIPVAIVVDAAVATGKMR